MSDAGVDGQAVVNALAMRAGALLADIAVMQVQITKLQEENAELKAAAAEAPAGK